MILCVLREELEGERRVSLVPDSVKRLRGKEKDLEITVQAGAGAGALIADPAYVEAGARIESDAEGLLARADLVACIHAPSPERVFRMRHGSWLAGQLAPFTRLDSVRALAERGITSFSLDLLPRITRAQSMDVLSSMATISGYRAVLLAAQALPRLMPLLMTAAGTLPAARVLVIGAGVAGLQAIATARRLGAVVEAFDIRRAAKEQVESLGARFVEQPGAADAEGAGGYAKEQTQEQQAEQRAALSRRIAESDAVICTAAVPGRRAPILVTEDEVKLMRPGSVIVDLAAETGGNCALTRPGETLERNGVQILGPLNVPSSAPAHASQMFSRNLMSFVQNLLRDGQLTLDLEDPIVAGTLVTREGRIVHEGVRAAASV